MNIEVRLKLRSLLWGCIVYSSVVTLLSAGPLKAYNSTTTPLNDTVTVAYLSDSSVKHDQRADTINQTNKVFVGDSATERNKISESTSQVSILTDNVTEQMINVTTVNEEDEDDKANNASRLNLAVIPVIASLVLITGVCLKGCSLFRKYSRGSKDTPAGAYDIVEEGDDDFDEIEMRTDSASTVYYDTVSSFCSFLRKNEMDISANTLTGARFQQLKQEHNVSDKLLRDVRKRMAEIEATEARRESDITRTERKGSECIQETESDENPSDTSKLLFNTQKRRITRTPSGSSDVSADTEQSLLSETEKDTPVKRQRFKVSFVTETPEYSRTSKQPSETNTLRPIITNLKTSHSTMTENTNVSRPRTQSLVPDTSPKYSNDIEKVSSKLRSVNADEQNSINTYNTKGFGGRSKPSPTGNRRSLRTNRPPKTLCRGRSLDSRKSVRANRSDRSGSDVDRISNAGLYPQMVDRAIQTDKSFRLSIKRGRKRYFSDTCTDENVIPPTISELVEMCQCSAARNNFKNSRNNPCVCNNSLDDICDDVFDNDGDDIATVSPVTKDGVQTKVANNKVSDGENRLTNHEWSSGHLCPVSKHLNSTSAGNNGEIVYSVMPSDMSTTHSRDIKDVTSLSTHNISDNKNDSNGNLLAKYCDKCHNINRSVPNLCCACQAHPLDPEKSSLLTDNFKDNKNKCKSCSHFNWTQLNGQSPEHRPSNNVSERRIKLYKRESSLASEDLSVSSSSLSSSGYVENSSDVSSA